MSRRNKHLRISEREKAILDNTKQVVYSGDDIAYGEVIARACQSLMADDDDGVSF